MPLDPDAQFDESVLEMIEHSPVGAVPNTPSYQDALLRLHAAHKVYADADHKGGEVTARSLAARSVFHAANLEDFMAGRIDVNALESNAGIFDRYVRSLPPDRREKAEAHRAMVAGRPAHHRAKLVGAERTPAAHDPMHTVFLVPGAGPHPGLPGNYLHGSVFQMTAGSAHGSWVVDLHDSDDGAVLFESPSMETALAKLLEVLESAPFTMDELTVLGFRFT